MEYIEIITGENSITVYGIGESGEVSNLGTLSFYQLDDTDECTFAGHIDTRETSADSAEGLAEIMRKRNHSAEVYVDRFATLAELEEFYKED